MALSTSFAIMITAVVGASYSAGATVRCSPVLREQIRVGDTIVRVSRPLRVAADTPILVLYHGFGSPADAASLERAIPPLPDAVTLYPTLPLTGDRLQPGGRDELIRLQREDYIGKLLVPVVSSAADELPAIIATARQRFGNTRSEIGVFGFSAGGVAALASLPRRAMRIRMAISLNSPLSMAQAAANWEHVSGQAFHWSPEARRAEAAYDVAANARRIAKAQPRASILFLQGDADSQFAPDVALMAVAALQSAYARRQVARVEMIAGMGHQLGAFDRSAPAMAAVKVREAFAHAFGITPALPCDDDATSQEP